MDQIEQKTPPAEESPRPGGSSDALSVRTKPSKSVSASPKPLHNVHCTLQHKGGVTKSFVASCLAQYYEDRGRSVRAIDADPSNRSFAAYRGLHVESLDIMRNQTTIDQRKFDGLIESCASIASDFVIDNGATNFLPLMTYLIENNIGDLMLANGRRLVLHVPIVGGADLRETSMGFDDIAGSFPAAKVGIVVWLNEAKNGPIVFPGGGGFEDTQSYLDHRDKMTAIIRVRQFDSELFDYDVKTVLSARQTFAEAIESPDTRLVAKQRLRIVQRDIFDQLAAVF